MQITGNVFIRTVTSYYLGSIRSYDDEWVELGNVSWVVRTGNFGEFLLNGVPTEFERYPIGMYTRISRSSIIELIEWYHVLP